MVSQQPSFSIQQLFQFQLFDRLKTNHPILDALIMSMVLGLISQLYIMYEHYKPSSFQSLWKQFLHWKYGSNKIIISGQQCTTPCTFGDFYITSAYSNRFNAVLDYIIQNHNRTIHEIRELYTNYSIHGCKAHDPFVVCQTTPFSIDPSIYFTLTTEIETQESNKVQSKIEKIAIEICSYCLTTHELIEYVEDITRNYRKTISEDRHMKQFIYTAIRSSVKEDETKFQLWDEQEFVTNRSFDNLFLENKSTLLQQIDFFLENRDWYDARGIPYNLGIGLYGKPGTGKTSFIKALAHKTKRDIVILPLKMIRNKRDLDVLFYENTYNTNNDTGCKTFDKKIIVFEDIDCIGDIVKKRKSTMDSSSPTESVATEDLTTTPKTEIELLSSIYKAIDGNTCDNGSFSGNSLLYGSGSTTMKYDLKSMNPDPLTLDDFLNLWDGIRETPGRMIVITSNHYDQLDPALIRPGRIDITYECKLVSHSILREMYERFYDTTIDENVLSNIKEYVWSPAEVMNLYMLHRNHPDRFIECLCQVKF